MSREAVQKLDEILATLPPRSRRMSFVDKCALYAALKRGFPQRLLARAFNITSSTVSQMANAAQQGGRLYQAVSAEYERLGHEDFCAHYLNDQLATKIQRFRMGVETEDDLAGHRWGPDIKSDLFAWRPFAVETPTEVLWAVIGFRATNEDLAHDDSWLKPGWAWRYVDERERERYDMKDRRRNNGFDPGPWCAPRFRTSGLCFDYVSESHGLEPPTPEFRALVRALKPMAH